eukprot:GDKJ01024725.1.p1 GENE.GDKJ01024725.1~~GDKJ01024725.1.p1  ORF type:complete len:229 (-),score=0.94 GDKJ01024725.1:297-983(-)
MTERKTKIGIIEDNTKLLANYTEFFEFQEDYSVCFSLENLNSIATDYKNNLLQTPDIILLDINLPGISGLDGIKLIKVLFPRAKIIMLTGFNDNENIITAIKNGASGYLIKGISLADLKTEVEKYKTEGAALTANVAKKMIQHIQVMHNNKEEILDCLTKREKEIIFNLLVGLTYKSIGVQLNIKQSTVNQHLKNIYTKLNVTSKAELIYKCFIQPTETFNNTKKPSK